MGTSDAIKHFEALEKRYTTQHNGTACEHVKLALEGLSRMAEGPEVVRCAECRHRNYCEKVLLLRYGDPDTGEAEWGRTQLDFCSYGERKEGEHG